MLLQAINPSLSAASRRGSGKSGGLGGLRGRPTNLPSRGGGNEAGPALGDATGPVSPSSKSMPRSAISGDRRTPTRHPEAVASRWSYPLADAEPGGHAGPWASARLAGQPRAAASRGPVQGGRALGPDDSQRGPPAGLDEGRREDGLSGEARVGWSQRDPWRYLQRTLRPLAPR